MKKKVLIIGAGIGGLATAVRLLSKGYNVTIYEKEKQIGGKVNLLKTDGFTFDLTASILMMPDTYKEIFNWAGKNYEDYLNFIRLDPFYRVNYDDGNSYDFYSDLVKLDKTLKKISKKDRGNYLKLLEKSFEKYLLADKYFLNNSFNDFSDFFNLTILKNALKIKTLTSSYDYIKKYIENEKLIKFLCYQALFVGISPFNGPNIYTLIPAVSHINGLWHLKGGMYSYIKALEKIIKEFGGIIKTNSKVDEIIIDNKKVIGLKTDKGIKNGDIVICNANFSYAMNHLIEDESLKGKYTTKKISNMKQSCSTFIIYLGLKKKYPKLLVHNLYLGKDFKENIEDVFKGYLPKNPSLYIYCPSRIDNLMALKDRESLNIMLRVPNLSFDKIKWNKETIKLIRKRVLNSITKIDSLDDIEKNIIYESYLTPKDLLTKFNSYKGTAYGLSHTLTQTNYFRPHIKSKTTKDLYFVGESVHPGTGVSMVLLSSKLVAEEILKDEKY